MESGCVEKLPPDNRQSLELPLKAAELALWNVDLQQDTMSFDQAWAEIFGRSPDDIGQQADFWLNLIHPEDRQKVSRAWEEHLEGSTERFETEHRIKSKSGEWKWLLARGKTVERMQDGTPLRVSGVALDITDLKRAAEEILLSQTKALARSNKDLEEFAYVAAHDLREPLIGIAAYIKLLERRLKKNLDAETQKFISSAFATIGRMERLIQTLLQYARLEGDAAHLSSTDCNLVVAEALSGLRESIEECKAALKIEPLPIVPADQCLLVQLFRNLLSNAIRFAGVDPLRIHVGAHRDAEGWCFFVKDNGIGIEPSYFDRIFDIFQRIDSNPGRPGTGIGLANCKKIVERHGGRIWVESVPGTGSTFFFTIPYQITSGS